MSSQPKTAPPTEATDRFFAEPKSMSSDFKFDEKVAAVFDDMVSRSVPYYNEMQRMTSEIAADFAVEGTNLFDLGCATGTTIMALDATLKPGVRMVGVDDAEEMLVKARAKVAASGSTRPIEFVRADLHREAIVENASVAVMILTLQFMRPLMREKVIANIARGMNEQGCFILIEKLTMSDSTLNRLFIKYYHEYKRRRGYSDIEITQKREALENVLIPYRLEENRDLLLSCGFNRFEVFFRWYNFCGMIAIK